MPLGTSEIIKDYISENKTIKFSLNACFFSISKLIF